LRHTHVDTHTTQTVDRPLLSVIARFGSPCLSGEVRHPTEALSALDFLVILDHLDPAQRARLMGRIRVAIHVLAPIDIYVTDLDEFDRRKDVNGSMLYWPAREGQVVYERDAA
jgi:hypothetical protein